MDLAAIPLEAILGGGVGLSAMGALAFYLVLTGRLVPRSALEDARDDRDGWQAAHARSEESRGLLLEELRRTTTALERIAGTKDLGVALLRSVRREATSGDEQEEDR